jgi:hypothetical protein
MFVWMLGHRVDFKCISLYEKLYTTEIRKQITMPNTYQASVVKRADGCIAGAGWPSEYHMMNHLRQAFAADLISVAGHSL